MKVKNKNNQKMFTWKKGSYWKEWLFIVFAVKGTVSRKRLKRYRILLTT
jgi:hypothetical protein